MSARERASPDPPHTTLCYDAVIVICPLCEHVQAEGTECDVCGRRLGTLPPAAIGAPSSFEGLGANGVEQLDGLETTAVPRGDLAVEVEPSPWLERTMNAPVEAGAAAELPGLERSSAGPRAAAAAAAAPGAIVCRYCRTPAAPGDAFCGRCGMRIVVYRPATADARPEATARCRVCGASVTGPACPACGARVTGVET